MEKSARLRVVRRPTRFFSILPGLRWLAFWGLFFGLTLGALRWFSLAQHAGALAFTPRVVGEAASAVGVKDVVGRDINRDGRADIITAGNDGVKIYENTGAWSWSRHVVDDKRAERVVLSDIDKDNDLDLVVSFLGSSPSVRWYRNNGDFEFSSTSIATAGADALAAVADFNADSWPDIASVSRIGEDRILEVWMNSGSATFTSRTLDSKTKATALAAGDIIRNGYADIVTGGAAGLQRWSTADGTAWTRVDIDDSNQNRTHLALADAPNGSAWIVTGDTTDNELVLYRSGRGDAASAFGRTFIDSDIDAKTVAASDLDGDGDLDLLAAAQDTNDVHWYQNDGLDIFTKHSLAAGLQSVSGVATSDLDGDGDQDVITADLQRGTVYAYERLRKKPTATAPSSIQQSSNGTGLVTFTTTIADDDGEATRARIQYSTDGDHWYKPWLTKVAADAGSVDLVNKEGYQVGTKNAIDTDVHDSVTLTLTWDTKSSENTGGPIVGDVASVQLRVLPRDGRDIGAAAVTSQFRVDNKAPENFTLKLTSIEPTAATLSWTKPSDSSTFSYELYYGTNNAAVLERRSDVWPGTEEAPLTDSNTTSTTITGLEPGKMHTFKLFATDQFGNIGAAPGVQGRTIEAEPEAPAGATPAPVPPSSGTSPTTPTAVPPNSGATPGPTSPPAAGESPTPTPTPEPTATAIPTPTEPPTLKSNQAPVADAGPDQVVNPGVLVILDGTASFDPDPGDSATMEYSWRQIDGPAITLLSDRTATPSFSAGKENETYIFSLTGRDVQGASAIDTVTVATKSLPQSPQVEVEVTPAGPGGVIEPVEEEPLLVSVLLKPADLFLLALSLISTLILVIDRFSRVFSKGGSAPLVGRAVGAAGERMQSRVVHYKTGEPIAGVMVLVYGEDGKLRAQERTNAQGSFASFFPPGVYTLGVRADGFAFAPAANKSLASADSIMYSGGKVTVKDANHPPSIIIPMKPMAGEVTNMKVRLLHMWQTIQHLGRVLSWPLFLAGAILNTVLVFLAPGLLYLLIEVIYVILVVVKIAVEIKMRPAYGLVRDAITHIPLELAVVRLLESGTNRLVMTRVTNNQGKFFALPPPGTYTITISKPGYGTFTKDGVEIVVDHDTTLQVTADLMPVAPQAGIGGLTRARAATL